MNERLQTLRRAIAALEAVKVHFFDQDEMTKGMWPDDERNVHAALASLRSYEQRESR